MPAKRSEKPKRYDYVKKLQLEYFDITSGRMYVHKGAKAILRRLVREAIERSGLGWPSQRDMVMDRIAKELVP